MNKNDIFQSYLLAKSNPDLYVCNQLREFGGLTLKALFSDCEGIFQKFKKMSNLRDNDRVYDAIKLFLDLFNEDGSGMGNYTVENVNLLIYLLAPVIRSLTFSPNEYFPLKFSYSEHVWEQTNKYVERKYLPIKQSGNQEDILQDLSKGESTSDNNAGTEPDIMLQPHQVTDNYAKVIGNKTNEYSFERLITITYACILVLLDGRTNEYWEPYCLPQIEDIEEIDYKLLIDQFDDILCSLIFPTLAVMDEECFNTFL